MAPSYPPRYPPVSEWRKLFFCEQLKLVHGVESGGSLKHRIAPISARENATRA